MQGSSFLFTKPIGLPLMHFQKQEWLFELKNDWYNGYTLDIKASQARIF